MRFRRAVALMVMTLVLPGSAQLVAGNRQVGRVAMRIWIVLVAGILAAFGLGLVWSGFASGWSPTPVSSACCGWC